MILTRKAWLSLLATTAMVTAAVAADAAKQEIKADVDVTVGKRPASTETVTITKPLPDGGTMKTVRETVTDPATSAPRKPRTGVPADTTVRRPRVVVVPTTYAKDVRSVLERELKEKWGFIDMSAIENPGYTSFVVDALVNADVFDILEREKLDSAVKELDFGESDYANVAKAVRLGGMLNADFVVIPEVRYFGLLAISKPVPYVNTERRTVKGKLSTSVRVVEVSSSRIATSSMNDAWVTNSLRRVEESPANPLRDVVDAAYKESARQVADCIVNANLQAPVK